MDNVGTCQVCMEKKQIDEQEFMHNGYVMLGVCEECKKLPQVMRLYIWYIKGYFNQSWLDINRDLICKSLFTEKDTKQQDLSSL